jgi:biotin transport system substrate-specific component
MSIFSPRNIPSVNTSSTGEIMNDAVVSKASSRVENKLLTQAMWIAAFATLTALGARVEIPNHPVPYTLQTFFVLLAGAMLGARNGAISMILYLALGAIGLPVFSSGGFGVLKFVGPTGGYLLAFPVVAAVVGLFTESYKSYFGIVASMFAGLMILFLAGTLHLNAFYLHNISAAFTSGFLIFSWWDMVKLFAAASIYFHVAKRWRRVV